MESGNAGKKSGSNGTFHAGAGTESGTAGTIHGTPDPKKRHACRVACQRRHNKCHAMRRTRRHYNGKPRERGLPGVTNRWKHRSRHRELRGRRADLAETPDIASR